MLKAGTLEIVGHKDLDKLTACAGGPIKGVCEGGTPSACGLALAGVEEGD